MVFKGSELPVFANQSWYYMPLKISEESAWKEFIPLLELGRSAFLEEKDSGNGQLEKADRTSEGIQD
jgi:hypothetical protein